MGEPEPNPSGLEHVAEFPAVEKGNRMTFGESPAGRRASLECGSNRSKGLTPQCGIAHQGRRSACDWRMLLQLLIMYQAFQSSSSEESSR
jgi:hypothetical protein